MASNKIFRTTIQLPLGNESGACSIQVPMSVFGSEEDENSRDELIAEFTAKITASFSKISREVLQARKPIKREVPDDKETQPDSTNKRQRRNQGAIAVALRSVGASSIVERDQDRDDNAMITIEFHYSGSCGSSRVRMKRTTRLFRILEAFAEETGLPLATLIMDFEGSRVLREQTPEMLEMVDADSVYVHKQQYGF